jgi:hypothetical protein
LTLGLEEDHHREKEIQNLDSITTWPQLFYEDAIAVQEDISQLQESPILEIPIDPALLNCDPMYRSARAEDLPESSTATIENKREQPPIFFQFS